MIPPKEAPLHVTAKKAKKVIAPFLVLETRRVFYIRLQWRIQMGRGKHAWA